MSTDIYSPSETALLEAWFEGRTLSIEDEELLQSQGFDHDPCEAYTRLDAWVGAFAVRDIQERLGAGEGVDLRDVEDVNGAVTETGCGG